MGGLGASSAYDNLIYNNMMLGNWLGTIQNNNNSLYENMNNSNISDQMMHKNNMERYMQAEQQQKML